MRLIYGFDALCGWCFGFVPAMRAVQQAFPDLPIDLAMPGLVTGARIGPYAEMEGYIRSAVPRLQAVTGRAPSQAFFDLITRDGVQGDSRPPIAAIAQVAAHAPGAALGFAHAVIEAHFLTGADLNRVETFDRLAADLGLGPLRFDLEDADLIARTQAAGRTHCITAFPTLIVQGAGRAQALPSLYDPAQVVAAVGAALGSD